MGIATCLIFGLLSACVTRSILTTTIYGKFAKVLLIGIIGGMLGLLGIIAGWGDLKSFNLYNVLLSIFFSSVLVLIWTRLQPEPKLEKAEG